MAALKSQPSKTKRSLKSNANLTWDAAVGGYLDSISPALRLKYQIPLDLLAHRISGGIFDFDNPNWVAPSGCLDRRQLSIAILGSQMVEECEAALNAKVKSRSAGVGASPISAKQRSALFKSLSRTAKLLQMGGEDVAVAARDGSKWLRPPPMLVPKVALNMQQERLWLYMQFRGSLDVNSLTEGLTAIAEAIKKIDHRRRARRRAEGPDTELSAKLVTVLRIATGADWHFQAPPGGAIPKGGNAPSDVVRSFVHVALPNYVATKEEHIEARLKSRGRSQ